MIDKKLKKLEKILEHKKEKVIVDLMIKNYDKANFYLALVFNYKIEKFKVLFVPLDAMELENEEEYLCYQFVFLTTVNYILETINGAKDIYQEDSFRNRTVATMNDAYYLEINTHVDGEDYQFKANQIIPNDWKFLFEAIVILFEYAPNVVSELCNKILALFNNVVSYVKYDYSFDLNFEDACLGIFNDEEMKMGKEYYLAKKITFLEKIQDKYYAIINGDIVILECNLLKRILNVYSNNKKISKSCFYALILAINDEFENKFIKIRVYEDKQKVNYLCYEIKENGFLVICNNEKKIIPLDDIWNIKVVECNIDFKEKLNALLENKFDKKEFEKIKKELYEDKM